MTAHGPSTEQLVAVARQDADTPDDQSAELGWREVLDLAELQHHAQAVLDALLEGTAPSHAQQAPR